MPQLILAQGQDGTPLLSDQSLRGQGSCTSSPTSLGITRRIGAWAPARGGLPRYEPVCTALRRAGGKLYLPDKEFRYLRTVIVTAAVYRGLVSRLRRRSG